MSFERSCKFYENSRCILGGNFCDLNCEQLFNDDDFKFYDKIDSLTQWRMEEAEREIESSGWKLK